MTAADPSPLKEQHKKVLDALRYRLAGSATLHAIAREADLDTRTISLSLRTLAGHDLVRYVSGRGGNAVWEVVLPPL